MRAKLSYKSKRNIVIALIIMVLFAASVTTTYFFVKGNQDSSAAFTGRDSQTSENVPTQGSTEGTQNNQGENGETVVPNVNDNNGENATTPAENQTTRPTTQIGQNGTTTTQTTGNVPNQEYVTERTEQETVLVSENYAVVWTALTIEANTTTSGRSIVRPEITATKTVSENAVEGEKITYTITVSNNGAEAGTATVKDTIPDGTTFVEGSIKVNEETSEYTAEDLEKGIEVDVDKNSEVAVKFEVTVNEDTVGAISNIAKVNEEDTNAAESIVVDTIKPVVFLNGVDGDKNYAEETIEADKTATYEDKGARGTDNVDGDFTIAKATKVIYIDANGNETEVDKVDMGKTGDYKLEYTYTDAAGNTAMATRIVKVEDTIAPKRVYSTIRATKGTPEEEKDKVTYYYVKNDNSFVFAISFNEELKQNPIAEIGNREIELKINEKVKKEESKYLYEGTFEISKDESELPEGLLKIIVKNIIDLAGNEATSETETVHTETSNHRSVIYDRTIPTLNFTNGNIVKEYTVEASDENFAYMTVQNMKTGKIQTIEETTFTLPSENADNVRYMIVAYDKAGNASSSNMSIYHDNTKPTITGTGKRAESVVDLENEGRYQSVTLKISDGSLKKIVRVIADEEEVLEEKENNYTNEPVVYEHTFAEEGTYTIKGIDRAGNENTITFTIDTTAPVITLKYDEQEGCTTKGNEPYFSEISFNFEDDYMVDKCIINGKEKELTDCKWSNVNYKDIKDYLHEGENTIVLVDVAGNKAERTFTIDWTKPVIKLKYSDKAGETTIGKDPYFSEVSFDFEDNYMVDKCIINGKEKELGDCKWSNVNYMNIKDYLHEGENTIILVDVAGNKAERTFTIDWTKPVIKLKYSDKAGETTIGNDPFSEASFNFEDNYMVDKCIINGKEKELGNSKWSNINYKNITGYLHEGENTIVLVDVAGNKAERTFTIDWTKPVIKLKYSDKAGETTIGKDPYFSEVSFDFEDNYMVDKCIINGKEKELGDCKWSNVNYMNIKDYLHEGENTIVLVDVAGNKAERTFTIDWTKPVIKLKYSDKAGETTIGKDPYFSEVSFDFEDNYMVDKCIINGKEKELGDCKWSNVNYMNIKDYLHEGENTIILVDVAGNKAERTFTIDWTKPVIKLKYSDKAGETTIGKDPYFSEVSFDFEDNYMVDKCIINGKEKELGDCKWSNVNYMNIKDYLHEGENTIILVDVAGNRAERTFTIDWTKPECESINVIGGNYVKEDNAWYTKNDGYVAVYVRFNEELSVAPVLKIEGIDEEIKLNPYKEGDSVKYGVRRQITSKDKIQDGEMKIEISGYKDLAENEGRTLTNADIKGLDSQSKVIIDRTAPILNILEGQSIGKDGRYSKLVLEATDEGGFLDYYLRNERFQSTIPVANRYKNSRTFNVDGQIKEGENTIVVYDKAGNPSNIIKYIADETAPKVLSSDFYVNGVTKSYPNEDGQWIYAKKGKTVVINARFDEKLAQNPTIVVKDKNNKEYTLEVINSEAENGNYLYVAKLEVSDEVAEGELTYTVSNISDVAGNKTEDITKATNSRRIVVDKTAPVLSIDTKVEIEFGGEFVEDIKEKISDNITAVEDLKVEIYPVNGIEVDTTKIGTYQINYKISDRAGNFTVETRTVKVEDTYAMFIAGPTFNSKIKSLSNSIVTIERANAEPTTDNYIEVQTDDSTTPIKMWKDENDDTKLLWYTKGKNPKLNSNSSEMFYNLNKLTSQDITNVCDTSNVTTMRSMFENCRKLTKLDVSNFDTSNVTNMETMFSSCYNLETLDVSNFNTSKVTNMRLMFANTGMAKLDLSNFDTSNVTDIDRMFIGADVEELNVSSFDTSKATNMWSMFANCEGLTTLDVSNFDTHNVTNMSSMFEKCSSLTKLDLNKWNTSKVTNMSSMFEKCSSLTKLDLNKWNTSKVTNMSRMFYDCKNLNTIYLSNWNTSSLTDANYMFYDCTNLTSIDPSRWNTSQVTNMKGMFGCCSNLTNLDISNWNTSRVTDMMQMFLDCTNLTSIDPSNWNTSRVSAMNEMFNGCSSLTELDLTNWDTSKARNMKFMFSDCTNLKTIYASDKFTARNNSGMFSNCMKLVGGNGTKYGYWLDIDQFARIDRPGTRGFFTSKEGTIATTSTQGIASSARSYVQNDVTKLNKLQANVAAENKQVTAPVTPVEKANTATDVKTTPEETTKTTDDVKTTPEETTKAAADVKATPAEAPKAEADVKATPVEAPKAAADVKATPVEAPKAAADVKATPAETTNAATDTKTSAEAKNTVED